MFGESEVFWEEGTWCTSNAGCQDFDFISAWSPAVSALQGARLLRASRDAENAGVSWNQTKRLKTHQEVELLGESLEQILEGKGLAGVCHVLYNR